MKSEKPDEVILAAAKGEVFMQIIPIPAEFIYQNLQIQNNVIHAAHLNDVKKLLFLGSSCIYPRQAQQPIREGALLTGVLEPPTNPMRSQRLQASKCVRVTIVSMVGIIAQLCQLTLRTRG